MNKGNNLSFLSSISTEDKRPLLYMRINDTPGAIVTNTRNRNRICTLRPYAISNIDGLLMSNS